MALHNPQPPLPWLEPGDPFPPAHSAWGPHTDAPGLLAAGGQLDAATLIRAYQGGIFPWFSGTQPPLWWSTDPRMVLHTAEFRMSDSLRREIRRLLRSSRLELRMDHAFDRIMAHCASTPRAGQNGTWITPDMVSAYGELHRQGLAHSVETWWDGELVGGLYVVSLGGMVYGESMFCRRNNASKMALAALVAFCRANELPLIDCQQETAHLARMGARAIPRAGFLEAVKQLVLRPMPSWRFESHHWQALPL